MDGKDDSVRLRFLVGAACKTLLNLWHVAYQSTLSEACPASLKLNNNKHVHVYRIVSLSVRQSQIDAECIHGSGSHRYQPRFDVIISSEFGSPNVFKQGFDPSLVGDKYGSRLHVWSWQTKEHKQVLTPSLLAVLITCMLASHHPST